MPLVSSPNTGYPDGQRIENYDSGLLAEMANIAGPGPYVSTLINMQHYAACAGNLACTVNPCACTLAWYDDIATDIQAGLRTMALSPLIQPGNGGMLLPNLGPFLQITFTNIGGLNFTGEAIIFGSNRVSPIPFIPTNSALIDQQNAAIAANSTATLYPTDYYAGPAQVSIFLSQGGGAAIDILNTNGNWDVIGGPSAIAANVWSISQIVVPPGAWRLQVANLSANAGTYYAVVVPTLTGAS